MSKERKSKIQVLESIIDKELKQWNKLNSLSFYSDFYWDDEEEYFYWSFGGGLDCDNCGRHYCRDYDECQSYKYIKLSKLEWLIKWGKAGKIYFEQGNLFGDYIDLDSITIDNKQVLRERKINLLLGIEHHRVVKKPTFGDLLKLNTNS